MYGAWGIKLSRGKRSRWCHSLGLQLFGINLVSLFVGFAAVLLLFRLLDQVLHFQQWLPSLESDGFDLVMMGLIWLLNLAFYLGTFYLLFRKKQRYLREITAGIKRLGEGWIGETLPVRGQDEIAEICRTINRMSTELAAQIQKERETERTKNRLIRDVGHDLRTPLTSLRGYLQLLRDKQYADEKEQEAFIRAASGKAEQLTELIETLFEYTRLSDPARPLQKVRFDLAQLVNQFVVDDAPLARKQGLQLQAQVQEKGMEVMGEPALFARLMENLLGNALKYTTTGGTIQVILERLEDRLQLMIGNNCAPVPPDQLAHLFDQFYRLESSRSTQTGGSGLGLAIVKVIVEKHGGTIAARYQNGQLQFVMQLPAL